MSATGPIPHRGSVRELRSEKHWQREDCVKQRDAVLSLLKNMTETQTQTPEASIELLSAGLNAINGKYIKKAG